MSDTTKSARHLSGLRNARYGEVLLISPGDDGRLKAAVYNTFGLNDCPPERWNALDPSALAQQFNVPMVFLNGPRFWTIDEVTAFEWGDTAMFDGLEARCVAEVHIPAAIDPTGATGRAYYVDSTVKRDTEYVLSGGRPVHALVTPDDRTYVLQAYSHTVDDSQTLDSLATLDRRLRLPEGWQYRVHTLEDDLVVRTVDGEAHVVQDELENTYMLLAH
ncbi:hypothetical protein AB0K02_01435 [Streptomyces sp. NPDC049597]|uniref:hypothetical protein n=1 Tax=Streptomyces sp. NPDC049597 TaxID=3155276 RepID=UPI003436CFC5